ncbi:MULTISPECIES: OmpA family protein [Chitinophagaceae]
MHHEEDYQEKSNTRIIFPEAIVLGLIAMLFAYGCQYKVSNHEEDKESLHNEQPFEAAEMPKGTVDAAGNFIYDEGQLTALVLGKDTLHVGQYSTEYKLYAFLNDSNAALDTMNGNWFDFTNVRFNTGSATITDSSYNQLKNLTAIIKFFPKAQFKIGGYTDNTGDSAANVKLSQNRADVVLGAIQKLGVSATQLTGAKGYGPEHPVGDNATAEGRAVNRRVSVNVKAK